MDFLDISLKKLTLKKTNLMNLFKEFYLNSRFSILDLSHVFIITKHYYLFHEKRFFWWTKRFFRGHNWDSFFHFIKVLQERNGKCFNFFGQVITFLQKLYFHMNQSSTFYRKTFAWFDLSNFIIKFQHYSFWFIFRWVLLYILHYLDILCLGKTNMIHQKKLKTIY